MTIERTRDLALVRSILTHPSQVRMSSDDATDVATWNPHDDERVRYLAAFVPTNCVAFTELLGIFTLIPQSAECFEIHAALLPAAWGSTRRLRAAQAAGGDKTTAVLSETKTRQALRAAIAWMFEYSPARRIVASVPAYNRLAIALGRAAGMSDYGRNEKSFRRHGALHDQVLLDISRL